MVAGQAQASRGGGARVAREFDARILLAGVIVLCWTYLHLEARQQRQQLLAEVAKWQNEAQALRAWKPR